MSSHFPIYFPTFPTFQWAPIPPIIFLLFQPFNELPFPHSFSYFSMTFPLPHPFSYFSYLSVSSHSSILFPTFQWLYLPPSIWLLFQPFIELPFPHLFSYLSFSFHSPNSFSYFFHLSMSSHSPIHFPTFNTFQWTSSILPFTVFSYFCYLSISSHSPIHFPTFHWASIFPFIFLLFLPFNELPFRIHFLTFPTF